MRRIALAVLVATEYGLVGASGASAAPANGATIAELGHLVQRFRDSNHIRRPDRAYRTKCGRRDGG